MGLQGVLGVLNGLKAKKIIRDYAIGGGYAVNYYLEPTYTYDLDILVLLDSDVDYHKLYKHFRESGYKLDNVYIVIDDLPVQFLPSFISPLFDEAIKKARKITIKGISAKVIRAEYLIALLLVSFRPKDKIRIVALLEFADMEILKDIMGRFEDEKTPLRQRFGRILENL